MKESLELERLNILLKTTALEAIDKAAELNLTNSKVPLQSKSVEYWPLDGSSKEIEFRSPDVIKYGKNIQPLIEILTQVSEFI